MKLPWLAKAQRWRCDRNLKVCCALMGNLWRTRLGTRHHEFGIAFPIVALPTRRTLRHAKIALDFPLPTWPVGPMDKASASGARDSRFESWAGH